MIDLFTDDRKKLTNCVKLNLIVIVIGVLICLKNADLSLVRIGPRDDLYAIGVQLNTVPFYIGFALYLTIVQITLLFTEEFALPVIDFSVYNPQCEIIDLFDEIELKILTILVFITKGILKSLKILLAVESIDSIILLFLAEEIATIYTVSILLKQKKFSKITDISKSEANMISQVVKSIFS